jgi:dihydroxyacetone kinase-like protein
LVTIDATAVVQALVRVRQATENAQAELDRLDAVAGDGDHGVTMVLGWRAVAAALEGEPPLSPGGALRAAAEAFASVGGTAGPLWGTALLRSGRALGDTPAITATDLARATEAAAEGIRERGRCAEGDRTVLDAMAPAAAALRAAAAERAGIVEALRRAAAAAAAGADATAALEPKRGRAARARERVRGHADAGARACAIFWAAVVPR